MLAAYLGSQCRSSLRPHTHEHIVMGRLVEEREGPSVRRSAVHSNAALQ